MRLNTLLAAAVAAAFALPLAAQASADSDRMILAQAGGPAGASQQGTGPTGGVPSPRTAGEPKAAAGEISSTATRDEARCKDLTGMERDKCMSDNRASTGGDTATSGAVTSGGAAASGGATGSSQTGTTAGPGEASNRTAPSSDTATSPSTSGQGKAK